MCKLVLNGRDTQTVCGLQLVYLWASYRLFLLYEPSGNDINLNAIRY